MLKGAALEVLESITSDSPGKHPPLIVLFSHPLEMDLLLSALSSCPLFSLITRIF
jgi:hypothetical protein